MQFLEYRPELEIKKRAVPIKSARFLNKIKECEEYIRSDGIDYFQNIVGLASIGSIEMQGEEKFIFHKLYEIDPLGFSLYKLHYLEQKGAFEYYLSQNPNSQLNLYICQESQDGTEQMNTQEYVKIVIKLINNKLNYTYFITDNLSIYAITNTLELGISLFNFIINVGGYYRYDKCSPETLKYLKKSEEKFENIC